MKKYLSGLITGVVLTALVGSLVLGAAAISSKMTIEVDPINIMVNGQVFEPKDVNGNPVPVFAYNGTTMAPLRALAEAYGLEVGYDKENNMATVVNVDKSMDKDKIEYVNSLGEAEAKYDYEFDPVCIFINDKNVSDDTHDSVVINQKTFFNVSKVAKACGIEVQISNEILSDGYATIQGDYYIPLLKLLSVIPTKDFNLGNDNILHLSI